MKNLYVGDVGDYPLRKTSEIEIEPLIIDFSVCKVTDYCKIDFDQPFIFIGKTDTEKSLVCPTEMVPDNVISQEDGWKAFRICGKLDFSLVGILAGITEVLAKKRIEVFVVSTYDTDYVLIKSEKFGVALNALQDEGYKIV